MHQNGFSIESCEIEAECIGYACSRKGDRYAVFFYAYGEEKTVPLDGEYCSELTRLKFSEGRTVLIVYLHVRRTEREDGTAEYHTAYYDDTDRIVPWTIRDIEWEKRLVGFPIYQKQDLNRRLAVAFNTRDFDLLQAICAGSCFLSDLEFNWYNDGFYSNLMSLRRNHGEMRIGYVRYNDVVYHEVGYLKDYGYFRFGTDVSGKISYIQCDPLDNAYKELIVIDRPVWESPMDNVPALRSVDFSVNPKTPRFTILLEFENGERKRYAFPGDFGDEPVVRIRNTVLTDKMFQNGRITEHLKKPAGFFYRDYKERGQGIEWISGLSVSTIELYHDSTAYPDPETDR